MTSPQVICFLPGWLQAQKCVFTLHLDGTLDLTQNKPEEIRIAFMKNFDGLVGADLWAKEGNKQSSAPKPSAICCSATSRLLAAAATTWAWGTTERRKKWVRKHRPFVWGQAMILNNKEAPIEVIIKKVQTSNCTYFKNSSFPFVISLPNPKLHRRDTYLSLTIWTIHIPFPGTGPEKWRKHTKKEKESRVLVSSPDLYHSREI